MGMCSVIVFLRLCNILAVAVVPVLGTSSAFCLVPVITITLFIIGDIDLNPWLATSREKREHESNPEE